MKFIHKWIVPVVLFTSVMLVSAILFTVHMASQASNQPDSTPATLSESLQLINSPSDRSVIRLYYKDRDHLNQIAGQLDIWEVHQEDSYVIAAVSPEQYHWLEVSGYRLEIDSGKTSELQAPLAPLDARFYYFDDFYSNANGLYVDDFLTDTNNAYPELTELIDIGDAWLAAQPGEHPRDMWVLRITNEDPVYGEIADKPVFFLFATIHAREVATPELAIRYIKYLTSGYNDEGGYGLDADATWLVNHNVLYVLVMQNPDGHWINEQNSSAYRRKNLDNDDGCTDPSAWGVDLNRNHNFLWGCCGGSSGNACSETYRGPARGSEPETQAFQDFFASVVLDQNGDNGDDEIALASPITTTGIFISLHSYADEVLWPWGFDDYGDAPNYDELRTIGRKFAYYNNFYPSDSIGYPVDGATDDWTYGKFGIASYTFEVGPNYGECGGFFPDYECIDGAPGWPENFWAENKPAFLYAHKIARTPYMTSYGPDAQDLSATPDLVLPGEPVQLTATIQDHRYSNDPLGLISDAEFFIDAPGEDGLGTALPPVDGDWGDLSEEVSAVIDTTGWEPGQHYILVHGENEAGDWGPFSAVFVNVRPMYAASLSPETSSLRGDPGQVVTYTLEISNSGYLTDTYAVNVDSLWPASYPLTVGPIPPAELAAFDVLITIPISATNGESETATVQIQSQGDPTVTDSATLETTANFYSLTVSPEQDSLYGLPGTDAVYSISVTNHGNLVDTYDLAASGNWTIVAPTMVGPLNPGESEAFDVTVQIPGSAQPGDSDVSTITLTSQGDATKSAISQLTTTAGVLGPLVFPTEITGYGDPETEVTYSFTITNKYTAVENFNITVSGNNWDVTAPLKSGLIAPNQQRVIEVTVSIPADAIAGASDTAVIEISSDMPNIIPVYANLTTVANSIYALAFAAETDTLIATQPGESVTFQVNVTNLGNAIDTYDLAGVSDWQVTLPETVGPLAPGETATVEVIVVVPLSARPGEVNSTTLTVTSQADPQVAGQLILTTRLQGYQIFLPISFKP